jgi:hypothetical protein
MNLSGVKETDFPFSICHFSFAIDQEFRSVPCCLAARCLDRALVPPPREADKSAF